MSHTHRAGSRQEISLITPPLPMTRQSKQANNDKLEVPLKQEHYIHMMIRQSSRRDVSKALHDICFLGNNEQMKLNV
eukprot:2290796-Amphidinium_carterae.2